jgi:hypothetical protein
MRTKSGTRWRTALLVSVMLVSACGTIGVDSCAGWKPIILEGQSIDGLTEADATSVLAHNEFGRARGCW